MRGEWRGGLHVPPDGPADPDRVTAAFAAAADTNDNTIRSDCAATRIELTGGRVSGVLTEAGTIRASTVVCAPCAWSRRLLRDVGVKIPRRSVRPMVVRTTSVAPMTKLTAWGDGVTFRPDRAGRFVPAGGASSI